MLSRREINKGTSICHILIFSIGRNLCVREWPVLIFKNDLYIDSYPNTQTCIYFSSRRGKAKNKLVVITVKKKWNWQWSFLWKFSFCLGIDILQHSALKLKERTCAIGKKKIWKSPENQSCIAWRLCQLQLLDLFKYFSYWEVGFYEHRPSMLLLRQPDIPYNKRFPIFQLESSYHLLK